MKKIFFTLLFLVLTNSFAYAKTGLLIIAHGSPSKEWNEAVFDLENQVKELLKSKNISGFDEVSAALMKFSEPSVNSVIKDMENKGTTEIYSLPLFIAPSEHSVYDLPPILWLYYEEEKINEIKKEDGKIVNTKIKITLGPTLNYKNVM